LANYEADTPAPPASNYDFLAGYEAIKAEVKSGGTQVVKEVGIIVRPPTTEPKMEPRVPLTFAELSRTLGIKKTRSDREREREEKKRLELHKQMMLVIDENRMLTEEDDILFLMICAGAIH
tara:strand:- start:5105 stop:5467 length:363 start_codon:yes stop_codon:yes gene_type:complete